MRDQGVFLYRQARLPGEVPLWRSAFYGQVFRDGARLNLRHVDHPVFDRARRAREDLLSATIVLNGIEPLFLEYQAKGVVFHQVLQTQPWGRRTFVLADPDGNLITFSD